jgi:hypothetical protein
LGTTNVDGRGLRQPRLERRRNPLMFVDGDWSRCGQVAASSTLQRMELDTQNLVGCARAPAEVASGPVVHE